MPNASMPSIACSTRSTFGQRYTRNRLSPPGRTKPTVEQGSPGRTARRMSILETTVPKSFDAQRTKAKTSPGANATVLRRGLTICSEATLPKRIQRWTRFSIQIRSTWVSVSVVAVVMIPPRARAALQHVDDGDATRERHDLDAAAQFGGISHGARLRLAPAPLLANARDKDKEELDSLLDSIKSAAPDLPIPFAPDLPSRFTVLFTGTVDESIGMMRSSSVRPSCSIRRL